MGWVASNAPPDPRTYAFKAWLESAENHGRGPQSHARTAYYIAKTDAGDGDGSSEANAKGCADIAAIATVVTAQGADTDFLLKRGEVWQGTVGLVSTAAGQGFGAWGTGNNPMLTSCYIGTDIDDGGGWSGPSSGVYTITTSGVTAGALWVRSTVPASGEAIDTDAWYKLVTSAPTAEGEFQISGSDLLVYPKATDSHLTLGVSTSTIGGISPQDHDNIYVRDIDFFGFGFNQSASYAVNCKANGTSQHYIKNVRGDGTARHVFGHTGTSSGGFVMFEGCESGSVIGNGTSDPPHAWVQYNDTGDAETIYKDCTQSGGIIDVGGYEKVAKLTLSHINAAETGKNDLLIIRGCSVTHQRGWQPPAPNAADFEVPAADPESVDPADYRFFVVDCDFSRTISSGEVTLTTDEDYIPTSPGAIWHSYGFWANNVWRYTLTNTADTGSNAFFFNRVYATAGLGGWGVNETMIVDASGTTADAAVNTTNMGLIFQNQAAVTATHALRLEHAHFRLIDGRNSTNAHWTLLNAQQNDGTGFLAWDEHVRIDAPLCTCNDQPTKGCFTGFANAEVGSVTGGTFGGLRNGRFYNVQQTDGDTGGSRPKSGWGNSTTSAAIAQDIAAEYTAGSVTDDMLVDNNVSLEYDRYWNRRSTTTTAAGPVAAGNEVGGTRNMGRGSRSYRSVR